MHVAVFGLGDSGYQKYNVSPSGMKREERGSSSLVKTCMVSFFYLHRGISICYRSNRGPSDKGNPMYQSELNSFILSFYSEEDHACALPQVVAKRLAKRLDALGAQQLTPLGLGDDQVKAPAHALCGGPPGASFAYLSH